MKKLFLIIIMMPFLCQATSLDSCYVWAERHYPIVAQYGLVESTRDYTLQNLNRGWLPQVQFSAQATYQSEGINWPEEFALYQDLTVEENLKFFATVFGTTIEENYDLIKDIYQQIEPFKTRPAGKLSGGMKQKLALSCALIHAPRVLFLDEPTTGVDPVSRKELFQMLCKLRDEKGITVFVTTHYMDEAEYCDRVSIMVDGRVEALDTPANLNAKYEKPTMYEVFLFLARKAQRS